MRDFVLSPRVRGCLAESVWVAADKCGVKRDYTRVGGKNPWPLDRNKPRYLDENDM